MKTRDDVPGLITCEKGLGRMMASACANRSLIADGKKDGPDCVRESQFCKGCVHGQERAAGKPKVVAPFENPSVTERIRRASEESVPMPSPTTKTCQRCFSLFEARFGNEKFCDKCRFSSDRPAEKRPVMPVAQPVRAPLVATVAVAAPPIAKLEATSPPQDAAAANRYDVRTCQKCERPFKPKHWKQSFCQSPCAPGNALSPSTLACKTERRMVAVDAAEAPTSPPFATGPQLPQRPAPVSKPAPTFPAPAAASTRAPRPNLPPLNGPWVGERAFTVERGEFQFDLPGDGITVADARRIALHLITLATDFDPGEAFDALMRPKGAR